MKPVRGPHGRLLTSGIDGGISAVISLTLNEALQGF